MSCDENHDARAEDRARRSLPVVGQKNEAPARQYWRSRDERDRAGAMPGAANEFPSGASQIDNVSRRGFMRLMGGSAAIAGVGVSCYRPYEKIVPYVHRPEEVTPGNALHFATAYEQDGYGIGLLVDSHEGRPTKIEGNPAHPQSLGATTAIEQALVLGLYDDDRAKQLRRGADALSWRGFLGELGNAHDRADGEPGARAFASSVSRPPRRCSAICAVGSSSGSRRRKFVSYSSVAGDAAVEGARLAFGRPLVPRHRLGAASVILSLDSDFLGEGPEQTRLSREFATRRAPSARHEPSLRRRAGHDGDRLGRRPSAAHAGLGRGVVRRRALRDAGGPRARGARAARLADARAGPGALGSEVARRPGR